MRFANIIALLPSLYQGTRLFRKVVFEEELGMSQMNRDLTHREQVGFVVDKRVQLCAKVDQVMVCSCSHRNPLLWQRAHRQPCRISAAIQQSPSGYVETIRRSYDVGKCWS